MTHVDHWRGITDSVLSVHEDINEEWLGEEIARMLMSRRTRPEYGIALSAKSKYLALGAGQARPELELAKLLGLQDANVTLLDRHFSPRAHSRFRDLGFEGVKIEDDMFGFLETPRKEKFDLITGFGIEMNYDSFSNLERLVAGFAANLNTGGVAILMPSARSSGAHNLFRSHGFVSLHNGSGIRSGFSAVALKPSIARGRG